MKNDEVYKILSEMAHLYELADENPFKVRAYVNAAQAVLDLHEPIEDIAAQDALRSYRGIGKSIAEKIKEFCQSGRVEEHERLLRIYPAGLLDMMHVMGLGPKRTRLVYEKLGIDSIERLKSAAQKNQLAELAGFGPKVQENILKGIATGQDQPRRLLLHEAAQISKSVVRYLESRCRSLEKCVPAGSLRRWKETIGDLDFLCVSSNPKDVIGAFVRQPRTRQILTEGETKASVILDRGVQCDLRVVGEESFGAALLYFTGSKEHNIHLREMALKKGLTINEYGLFALSNKRKAVAGKTEKEIYNRLGLDFIAPELRENRGEIAAAERKKLPKLIEEKDIRGDFHNHTSLSDGANTLEEMAAAAKAKGWEWFVSADHSQSLPVARGLSVKELLAKKAKIKKINENNKGFSVLLGAEVDILPDGSMDYETQTLREIDFVVGSVHTGFRQEEEKMTSRIARAMENPDVDIVGHLTGRRIGFREGYRLNVQRILETASRTQTAIEINGQPERMDMSDVCAKQAAEMRVPIALSTDAHSTDHLNFMTYAVANARRAWLTKEQVLNCLGLEELNNWKRAE